MTNQSFDNQVKQKISEHEMPVPPGTWEAIAQKKKKRRVIAWWWVTGVGILLLGMIGTIVFTNMKAPEEIFAGDAEQKPIDKYNVNPVDPGIPHVNQPLNDAGNETGTAKHGTQPGNANEPGSPGPGSQPANQLNQPDSPRSDPQPVSDHRNIDIQFSSTAIAEKKKQKPGDANNSSPGIANNSTTYQYQPDAATISTDHVAGTVNRINRIVEKADLIVHDNVHGISIAAINKTMASDSILAGNVKESASQLIRPKRPSLSIDIAINSFVPVRQKQSLAAITRTTINPMHTAEYRADEIKAVLQPAFSYGITLRKKINNKVGIGMGLQYAVIKEIITLSGRETNTHYSIVQRLENGGSGPRLINDTVTTVTAGTRTIDAVNSYRYLNLPLSLQYTLIGSPYWSLQLNGGIDISLYAKYNNSIGGKLIAENTSGPIVSKQSNTVKTGFFTGLRYSHYVNKRMQWFAEPYLRFNAGRYGNTVINNKAVHQAGIGVGLSFNIGKQ